MTPEMRYSLQDIVNVEGGVEIISKSEIVGKGPIEYKTRSKTAAKCWYLLYGNIHGCLFVCKSVAKVSWIGMGHSVVPILFGFFAQNRIRKV